MFPSISNEVIFIYDLSFSSFSLISILFMANSQSLVNGYIFTHIYCNCIFAVVCYALVLIVLIYGLVVKHTNIYCDISQLEKRIYIVIFPN